MKSCRLILLLALVLIVAGCQCDHDATPQPTFTADDETAIRGLLETFTDTVLAGDWAANTAYYTEDAVRMPPDAPMIQGHAAMVTLWETFPPVTGFTLTPQVVGGDGDMAYARGAFTLDLAPPDADPTSLVGKWQAAYQRQADGTWLCVSDIWNSDTPTEM
jgi:ketosteroid isomerase-like protein